MSNYTKQVKVNLDLGDNQISNADLVDCTLDGISIVVLTSEQYNAISVKDPNTLYFIKRSS